MKNIKSLQEFLFESKSSAKKRFLDRGLVSNEVFERFLDVDTTPTKKFIEKMCEFFVGGSTQEDIIQTFQKATKSNVKFDISTIKTLSELQEILSQEGLTGSRDRVQIGANEKGVEITYEDDRFTVLYITSKQASKKYGKGTLWCISAEKKNQWSNYFPQSEFYFIYDYKTTNKAWKKLAVEIRPDNKVEVYNTFDNVKNYDDWYKDIVRYDYLINNIKNVEIAFKYHKDLFVGDYKIKTLYNITGDITINQNGELDVVGDVELGYKNLYEIPIKFGRIDGNFDVSRNNLTTLKNAPSYVSGGFYCTYNNLTSLEYAPSYIGRVFQFEYNKLTSLEGHPKKVDGIISCYPQHVNGSLKRVFTKEDILSVCEVAEGRIII
jgi:hypothetical protein